MNFGNLFAKENLIKQIANVLGATNGHGRGPEAAAALQHEADLVHLQPKHGEDFVRAEARARCNRSKKNTTTDQYFGNMNKIKKKLFTFWGWKGQYGL